MDTQKNTPHVTSYVLRLGSIDFSSKILNLMAGEETFYYYISPDASVRFLTVGEIFRKNLAACSLDDAQKEIFPNHRTISKTDDVEFPLLFLQKMFNKENSPLWNDFENAVVIPEFVFICREADSFIIANSYGEVPGIVNKLIHVFATQNIHPATQKFAPVLTEDVQSKKRWHQSIAEIQSEIESGEIQKAVLSQYKDYTYTDSPNFDTVLKNLEKQTHTYRFAFRRGKSFVAGASPEKLFSLREQVLYSEAIAGSTPRGQSLADDAFLSEELMNSKKERFEHECVVKFIATALSKHAQTVAYNDTPTIKKLLRIMHLRTEIQAKCVNEIKFDDVINDLYPTPATCGEPKEKAFALINRLETHSRGLYCGLSGWLTNKQNGDFYILLRLALLKDNHMHVFAGCGIVHESDAGKEYEESQYKAESIIRLFYDEN